MTYESAKQLKEAGFPLKPMGGINMVSGKDFFEPTLDELIEACGEGIGIFKISNEEATAWKKNWPTADPDDVPLIYTGATPIVAVSNLWLALNGKTI